LSICPSNGQVNGKHIDPVQNTDLHSVETLALLLAIFLASPILRLRYVLFDVIQRTVEQMVHDEHVKRHIHQHLQSADSMLAMVQ
jgi:hypothetical protein